MMIPIPETIEMKSRLRIVSTILAMRSTPAMGVLENG
jgi:hypothetical protein